VPVCIEYLMFEMGMHHAVLPTWGVSVAHPLLGDVFVAFFVDPVDRYKWWSKGRRLTY
jgi:hypothetical protein